MLAKELLKISEKAQKEISNKITKLVKNDLPDIYDSIIRQLRGVANNGCVETEFLLPSSYNGKIGYVPELLREAWGGESDAKANLMANELIILLRKDGFRAIKCLGENFSNPRISLRITWRRGRGFRKLKRKEPCEGNKKKRRRENREDIEYRVREEAEAAVRRERDRIEYEKIYDDRVARGLCGRCASRP